MIENPIFGMPYGNIEKCLTRGKSSEKGWGEVKVEKTPFHGWADL